ncbi:UNVERIFIED_ORG: hypothetical protein BCL66_107153 [Martelella mediterranea]
MKLPVPMAEICRNTRGRLRPFNLKGTEKRLECGGALSRA